MKIAVVGATGFIGRHLCYAYAQRGDSVNAIARKVYAAGYLTGHGVKVISGDITDEDALCRLCDRADVVFNVSGVLGKWDTTWDEMDLVNNRSVGSLVRCAAKAGAGRVVQVSTAGVSGPLQDDVCASEDCPLEPATDYQKTKFAGESSAVDAHKETGIPLTIVRPAFVYGPGDMHKLSLFRAIHRGRMVLVNGGRSRLHPAYVEDVVRGMIIAAERAPGHGEAYILAGESPATTKQIIQAIAEVLSVPSPKISMSAGTLLVLGRWAERIGRLAGKEPPLTCSKVKLFSENYAYTIEKARTELGYQPNVSLPEGMKTTSEWYLDHGFMD